MATPSTLDGQKLYIKVETSEGSGVFNHPCLINAARGLELTSQGNDVYIIDCDDPDAPAIREHLKTGVEASVTGEGQLDLAALPAYTAWWKADLAKSVQVWFGTIGYIEMNMKLTAFSTPAERGDKVQCSLSLVSHGAIGDYTVV
ncbi:MAG: hypothetical protein AB7L41_06190 [Flavobacteriaceae bacterium]